MTRPLLLLTILTATLVSLSVWGDEASQRSTPPDETPWRECFRLTESGRRFTADEFAACIEKYNLWPYPPSFDAPGASGAADSPAWDLLDIRKSCASYMEWDPDLEACVRTAVPLPPELDFFESSSGPIVRPPEGVVVLYPDGTWTEEAACPPDLIEETIVANWRFCRDPERRDRIPQLWMPPVNGLPYPEVEEIHEANKDALMAIDGVSSVGLGATAIHVNTDKPELVPEAVEGVPIKTLPPLFPYRPVLQCSTG